LTGGEALLYELPALEGSHRCHKEKKILRYGSIILVLLTWLIISVSLSQAESTSARHVVVIDPAHGGSDRGVSLSEKEYEKNITLLIALELKKELQEVNNVSVQLTRTTDKDMPIAERIKAVRDAKADMVMSIHINAGFAKQAAGYELYYPGFNKPSTSKSDAAGILKDMAENKYLNDSVSLAQAIMRNLQRVFVRGGRGLREAPVPLLEGLSRPAVVVEIGFATNVEDSKTISDEKGRHDIVQALGNGIKEFYHIK
jgi:N-acetylmuramoyl-L-alanine amidase